MLKSYLLEGLDCAHCAALIEQGVSKMPGVQQTNLNFINKTLRLQLQEGLGAAEMKTLEDKIQQYVNTLEPDVVVKPAGVDQKWVYDLEGLDCAHCASLIEQEVGKLAEVDTASLNFVHKTLFVTPASPEVQEPVLQEKIRQIVQRLEPDVTIQLQKENHNVAQNQEKQEQDTMKKRIIQLVVAAVFYALGMVGEHLAWAEGVVIGSFAVALLLAGGNVLWTAAKNIRHGRVFDENFLMSIATIGAFLIQQYDEGVAVMMFYQVGELFQSYAVGKSRKSIAQLMDIRPDYANVKRDGTLVKVNPEEVNIGDIIVVKAGEKVPLDGVVCEGRSLLDTVALTGESVPREVVVGSQVLSGCINLQGVLTVKVEKAFAESTVAKILDLVENASSKKSRSENFISKFARYYTPIVVIIAAILAVLPPLLLQEAFSIWVYRALVFLVISCPCALVISVPLGFFGGIGGASKLGVLVKGSNYLEALAHTETVVFDKTGTLTQGVFQVAALHPLGMEENKLLELAVYAESFSNHPISLSLQKAYQDRGLQLDQQKVEALMRDNAFQEIAGYGVKARLDGNMVLVGNDKLMKQEGIAYQQEDAVGTIVYVALNGEFVGSIVIKDVLKPDAIAAIRALKAGHIKQTVMLTGDNQAVAEAVGKELGIDQVYAQLLPGDKVEQVEALLEKSSEQGKLVFVGDGVNDAPVLARADVGIAMGGLGSDAAIEAADVVIMTDEPSKLVTAIGISKHTLRIVKQNIVFALAVKLLVLLLGAVGIATMWAAVFADVGVAVIAILNAMRALSIKRWQKAA